MLEFNNFITAGEFFLEIAGELILIFVAVSFLIGLLTEYLPPSRIRDFLSGRFTWVQYLLGAGLGAITPFCSCSTVPITGCRGGLATNSSCLEKISFTGHLVFHARRTRMNSYMSVSSLLPKLPPTYGVKTRVRPLILKFFRNISSRSLPPNGTLVTLRKIKLSFTSNSAMPPLVPIQV